MKNNHLKKLNRQVVFVTAGSRGIGKEIVKKFVRSGSKVYFTYKNSSNKELRKLNIYKTKNRIFINKDFIEYAKENNFYESLSIQAFTEFEVNITGHNSFIETSISNKGDSISAKFLRLK